MTTLEAIGLISGIASIAGFFYAIYYARVSRREKLLVYKPTGPIPLATAVSPEDHYQLSVLFQRPGGPEERIGSAHVRFVRIANLGKEPIRRIDIAPASPLKLVVDGVRVLDIAISSVSRSVIGLKLDDPRYTDDAAEVLLTFDFLDHEDGGVIRILTVGGRGEVTVIGDIVGMPDGIKRSDEVRSLGMLNKLGCGLGVCLQIAAIAMAPLAFRWITGSWSNVWLLALPFLALALPAIIVGLVASTLWPKDELAFPASLCLPEWGKGLIRKGRRYSAIPLEHEIWDDEDDRRPRKDEEA